MLALVVAGLAGCGDDGESRLEALRRDQAVSATVDGVLSERLTSSRGNAGVGLPAPATVRRTFVLSAGPIGPALDQLAAAATAAGWVLLPRDVVGWSGRKTIDGADAQLVIAGVEVERTVWIEISARP